MADDDSSGDAAALWAAGCLSSDDADAVLDAVDAAFQQILYAKYGGGVTAILMRGGEAGQDQPLRRVPTGLSAALVLELHLRAGAGPGAPAGFARSAGSRATPLGVVTMSPAPIRGVDDITVMTEIFCNDDPNDAADAAQLSTGLLLSEDQPFMPGHTPGGGVSVVRSGPVTEGGLGSQQQRGWVPDPGRTRTNRSAGLGSNGHRRASASALRVPVAVPLLQRIGSGIAQAESIGGALDRIVVGLEAGDSWS